MSRFRLSLSGTIASPRGKGLVVPDFGCLYAAYFLGTGYETNSSPLKDWSGNSRDLAPVNPSNPLNGIFSTYSSLGTLYFTCPFTGDNLIARTGNKTAVSVHRAAASVTAFLVGSATSVTSTAGSSLFCPNNQSLRAAQNPNTPVVALTTDSNRGNQWQVGAGVYTPTHIDVYRKPPGSAASQFATGAYGASVGGAGNVRIGRANVPEGTLVGANDQAIVIFYDDVLTSAQLDSLSLELKKITAAYGLTL